MKAHTSSAVTRFPSFPRAKTRRPHLGATLLAALLAGIAPQAYAIKGAAFCHSITGYCGTPPSYQVLFESGDTITTGYLIGKYGNAGASDGGVTMTGGMVYGDGVIGGYAYDGNATGNTVTMSDGWVGAGNVEGGMCYTSCKVTYNAVTISGGEVHGVARGGYGSSGATSNIVTISGGKVDSAVGGQTNTKDATYNAVTISGGEVRKSVYGGDTAYGSAATYNVVILASGSVGKNVYGGWCALCSNAVTGNILHLDKAKDFPVGGSVYNFAELRFTLPDNVTSGTTMLKVAGSANFPAPYTGVKIKSTGQQSLVVGDTITLIEADGGVNIAPEKQTAITIDYMFEVKKDGNKLIATVTKTPASLGADGFGDAGIDDDSSAPATGELGLLLSGLALAGAAAPALRRREKQGKKSDTRL